MPHDNQGQTLAKGDFVTMTFAVLAEVDGETGDNVVLQAVIPVMFGEESVPLVSCNSKLITKIDATPRTVPIEPEVPTGGGA